MYVDDFIGLCTSKENLQKIIHICNKWSCKWRTQANVKKSAIMIVNADESDDKIIFTWGSEPIPRKNIRL